MLWHTFCVQSWEELSVFWSWLLALRVVQNTSATTVLVGCLRAALQRREGV
jgi:hypothetical protein